MKNPLIHAIAMTIAMILSIYQVHAQCTGTVEGMYGINTPSDIDEEQATAVKITNDDGSIVAGNVANGNLQLMKLYPNGTIEWQEEYIFYSNFPGTYQRGQILDVEQTWDGGYMACGWIDEGQSTGENSILFKTDAQGNVQWQYQWPLDGDDRLTDIEFSMDDVNMQIELRYYVVGYTEAGQPIGLKLDEYGNFQWQRRYYHDQGRKATGQALEMMGGAWPNKPTVAGEIEDVFGRMQTAIMVIEPHGAMTLCYSLQSGGAPTDGVDIIQCTDNGSYIPNTMMLLGSDHSTSASGPFYRTFLLKFNVSNGSWERTSFYGGQSMRGVSLVQGADNTPGLSKSLLIAAQVSDSPHEKAVLMDVQYDFSNPAATAMNWSYEYDFNSSIKSRVFDLDFKNSPVLSGAVDNTLNSTQDYFVVQPNLLGKTCCSDSKSITPHLETGQGDLETFTSMPIEETSLYALQSPTNLNHAFCSQPVATSCPNNVPYETAFGKGVLDETGEGIAFTDDCGSVIVGRAVAGDDYMSMTKLDHLGNISWHMKYKTNITIPGELLDVEQTRDGGYVACGWVEEDNGAQLDNGFIIRTDANGALVWKRRTIISAKDKFTEIEVYVDDQLNEKYVVTGYSEWGSLLLAQFDQSGNTDWAKEFQLNYYRDTKGHALEVTDEDGNGDANDAIIVSGAQQDANGDWQSMVARFGTANGNLQWAYLIPAINGTTDALDIVQRTSNGVGVPDNYVYVGGEFNPSISNNGAIAFVQINSTGAFDRRLLTSDHNLFGLSVKQSGNESFVIGGQSENQGLGHACMLLDLNHTFNGSCYTNWSKKYPFNVNSSEFGDMDFYDGLAIFTGTGQRTTSTDSDFLVGAPDANGDSPCSMNLSLDVNTFSGTAASLSFTEQSFNLYNFILYDTPLSVPAQEGCTTCDEVGPISIVQIGPFCEDDPAATLSATPAGGTFVGPGVFGNQFHPQMIGPGIHPIHYFVGEGQCMEMAEIFVEVLPSAMVFAPGIVCVNEGPFPLDGYPLNGTFSGPGVSGNTFDPAAAGVGVHQITYTVTGYACESVGTTMIEVLPTYTASLDPVATTCFGNAPVTLVGSPAGGTYSGPGVTGNVFDPQAAGVGTHQVIYSIGQAPCNSSDTIFIEVFNLVTLNSIDTLCEDDQPVTLSGSPAGGTYSGPGVVGNTFDPSITGPGTHVLQYSYGSPPCTATISVVVLEKPSPSIASVPNLCVNGGSVVLSATPAGGTFTGTGLTGNVFDPQSAGLGNHTITYTVGPSFCSSSTSIQIGVYDSVLIGMEDSLSFCETDYPFMVSASPGNGSWYLDGSAFWGGINPANLTVGWHTITYVSNSCSDADTVVFEVIDSAFCCVDVPFDVSVAGDSLYDDEILHEMKRLDDCGYIGAGEHNIAFTPQLSLVKTDANGQTEWYKTYSYLYRNQYPQPVTYGTFLDVEQTSDSGYVMCGWIADSFSTDFATAFAIVKTDYFGNVEWGRTGYYEQYDVLYDIEETSDGGYIAVGYADLGAALLVVKLDAFGQQDWLYHYSLANSSRKILGYAVTETDEDRDGVRDDAFVITGFYEETGPPSGDRAVVIRLNQNGQWMDDDRIPFLYSGGRDIVQIVDSNGIGIPFNYAITGYVSEVTWPTTTVTDALFLEINTNSGMFRVQRNARSYNQDGYSLVQIRPNEFVIAGESYENGVPKALAFELDTSRNIIWSQHFGKSSGRDYFRSVGAEPSSHLYFGGSVNGHFNTGSNDMNFHMVRTDLMGIGACSEFLNMAPDVTLGASLELSLVRRPDTSQFLDFTAVSLDYYETYCDPSASKQGVVQPSEIGRSGDALQVFPNPLPNNRDLTVQYSAPQAGPAQVVVTDITGKPLVVQQHEMVEGQNEVTVNTAQFASGMYLLRFEFGGKVQTRRIIVAN